MSQTITPPVDAVRGDVIDAVMEALPVGIAIIDAEQRFVLMNAAFHASLDLPPNTFPPGTRVEDAVRACALRGVYGPGDPEAQVAAIMEPDRGRPWRLRRRTFNGRSFDLLSAPLPDGGYVVCAVESTALIAARSEAEHALAQSNTALAALPLGLAAFASTRTLLFANPRFGELLGVPGERIRPGVSFDVLLHAMATAEEFAGADGIAFIDAQRDADRSRPMAMRRINSRGQVIDIGSSPLPDGGWTITVSDITPLATAEAEATRRARALDAIIEVIPHGICVYDATGRVRQFNRAYTKIMSGVPVAIGDHVKTILRRRAEQGEYGPGPVDEIVSQMLAFDVARPQMLRRRRPNGTVIDVRTAMLPDGGYISVVTDITPQTEAETELSHQAEEMAVMLASIRHGVLLWGADKRLIASNAIAGELLNHPQGLLTPGRSQDEVLDNMLQRGEVGEGPRATAEINALRARDRSVPYMRTVATRAGRILEMRSDPTPGGGWISTFTDVTEAHRAAAELRRAKEAAEAASQAKSRFLATMSHELRTPLNSVIGFSDALLREATNPSPARVTEFARQINESGRNLLNLINIILDVARIETGRFDLATDRIDVERLIRGAMRQTDAAAQAADLTLSVELPAHLPSLRADERRLTQVLRHLLSNAVKFTEARGTVTAGAAVEADGGLLIFVRDSGIGIPAADLERVFEPFTQLDSTLARRFPGSGLGLYMSRALIAGHGGTLTLRSTPGEGTSAEIRLPAALLLRDGAR